jgi:hypothetical protein
MLPSFVPLLLAGSGVSFCRLYLLFPLAVLGAWSVIATCPQLGDLLPALKARLTDSNRNLAAGAMATAARLARAMGRPWDRQVNAY